MYNRYWTKVYFIRFNLSYFVVVMDYFVCTYTILLSPAASSRIAPPSRVLTCDLFQIYLFLFCLSPFPSAATATKKTNAEPWIRRLDLVSKPKLPCTAAILRRS